MQNLASSAEHAGILSGMRDRLARWMDSTQDPLRSGSAIPLPQGARINDADDVSPRLRKE
jgi:hypothetical protein